MREREVERERWKKTWKVFEFCNTNVLIHSNCISSVSVVRYHRADEMDTINAWAEKLEGIPGYDMAVDWINDKAGENYQTKDPYYVEIHGKKKRRKAPETCTPEEQKAWKQVKKRAWLDDRNFFGCYPMDLGLGLAPLMALVPVIGPLLMFAIHGRLINIADQKFNKLPVELIAKMHANILFDLLISLPPILGSLFAWMNACSTRNAALIHTWLVKKEMKKQEESRRQEEEDKRIYEQRLTNNRTRTNNSIPVSQHDPFKTPQRQYADNNSMDRHSNNTASSRKQSQHDVLQRPQPAYEPDVVRGRQM